MFITTGNYKMTARTFDQNEKDYIKIMGIEMKRTEDKKLKANYFQL